jgi:hypothetical protein
MNMIRNIPFMILLPVFLALILGCGGRKEVPPPPPSTPAVVDTREPGTITCEAILDGAAPKMNTVMMNADRKCSGMHSEPVYFQTVITNGKGMLQNVFVYVKEGLGSRTFPAPSQSVEINQKGCMYEPHILGIQVNQPLLIVNSDPVLHNIHALPKVNDQFNVAQPRIGTKTEKMFTKPEVMVRVKCDVHSWMGCYIGVLDHPFYAVTDSAGSCQLKGLPPGDYLISVWHEKYGPLEQRVSLAAGEKKKIQFRFQAGS